MNADGSGRQRLTVSDGSDGQPAWSPDGRRIAFTSYRDGDFEIYVAGVSAPPPVASGGAAEAIPAVCSPDMRLTYSDRSPDGRKIAFVASYDAGKEISVMNADGSGIERLTYLRSSDAVFELTWSPDGRKIAFTSSPPPGTMPQPRTYGDGDGIYVMNADGSDVERLTHSVVDGFLAWSPDGRKIAFVSVVSVRYGETHDWEIYVVNTDGSGIERLTYSDDYDAAPAWSPDGRRIAFQSYRNGAFEIYVMNADGSSVERLTDTGRNMPAWSPDGRRIAFVSSHGIYAMRCQERSGAP